MASIIFYGVGQNAKEKFKRWKEDGLEPVCFADADLNKHHTFFEGIEVFSLFEAINKYPDYEIYCTQHASNLSAVCNYLRGIGIPDEKIKTCEMISQYINEGYKLPNTIYPQLHRIYSALQDDLSKKLFWGRIEYSVSHSVVSMYREMICDENMEWLKGKKTYAELHYGLPGLWKLLKDNYPIQKQKIYLIGISNEWNEFEWVVERFLEAAPQLGLKIEGCIMPYAEELYTSYKGIPCITEEELREVINADTRIIIGLPGWCAQTSGIIERFKDNKEILYPIADAVLPQYIEEDILLPREDEIFVDIGVFDLRNSIDFVKWAKNGYKKIYAFEPDPKCYSLVNSKIAQMDADFGAKIEVVNKGLGSQNCTLDFPAEYKGSGVYDGKTIPVEVVKLDDYLQGNPITFAKMDVEGAEMDVLLGMRETILRYKPKMAVCIYHKHEDIYEIASYLLDLVPEYKFYIRHYSSNETETVLFCIA